MRQIYLLDIEGKDGKIYRIRVFDDYNKITSSIHAVLLENGKEDEHSMTLDIYPQNVDMAQLLEDLKIMASNMIFKKH